MYKEIILLVSIIISSFYSPISFGQKNDLKEKVLETMYAASKFMDKEVSVNGGYVRLYLPDLSRRWGELEFYPTQVQVQSYGVVSMGNLFLDAYKATGDDYYYLLGEKAADALILGQLPCGGWNYMIDFAGDRSLKEWYRTIGKNAWGFEEFYHYYGNATFDDVTTSDAAKYLLRIYLQKGDPKYKPALDRVINLMLKSQYPAGGWPQRYPLKFDFPHFFETDYTSFYTFNDDAIWGNIDFLVQCYAMLGEERLLEPIQRGMNFYIITQQASPQAGWAQQYNLFLQPDHARTFEPAALCTWQTYENILQMIHFYKLTGDRRFMQRIPDAIKWLENSKLPENMTNRGRRTHALYIEIGTNRDLWAHRTGTGVKDQHYWIDYDTSYLYAYGDNTVIDIEFLKKEYKQANSQTPEEISKNSPLKVMKFPHNEIPQQFYEDELPWEGAADVARFKKGKSVPLEVEVKAIVKSLDDKNRWLSKHEWISSPYTVMNDGKESNTAMHAESITANWIMDPSEQEYISIPVFQTNMQKLIAYLQSRKTDK